MKLELPGIMLCEWDAVTKCIIVSPAEGWKVNINYPISEAHASMVTMEKMDGVDNPDWSHLIGKWVRYWLNGFHNIPEYGRWFKVNKVSWSGNDLIVYVDGWYHDNGTTNEVWKKIDEHSCCFDLTDARDYNPDEQTPGEEARDIALRNIEEAKKIKVERKPHQLQEYDAVECTPEERSEIIRIADECGVPMHREAMDDPDEFPYLGFSQNEIAGIGNIRGNMFYPIKAHTVPDFIAKIRGEYTAVNVTEYKHESV